MNKEIRKEKQCRKTKQRKQKYETERQQREK